MKFKLKNIPQNVFIFGLVSLLTDVSSDMIYPLLPVFLLQYLGAGKGFIGLIEGFAESVAALFTLFSGRIADRTKDRSKLVLFGYGLSSASRPLIAAAQGPWTVFFVRFSDRIGKGIRTSPRDALIADSVEPHSRGKAFGLQRTMDHIGAVIGPLIASLLLSTVVTDLRVLFWIAAIPGLLAVGLIFWKVREVLPDRPRPSVPQPVFRFTMPRGKLRIYLIILFLFMLSCSSDAFLILRSQELGVPAILLPILWLMFNLVKAFTTLPLGSLSDRMGRRRMILLGWLVYTGVYTGFAMATNETHAWVLFACYGLFYGFTEGGERALLADLAPAHEKGQIYGWYYLVVGIVSLPASLWFGWVWQAAGAQTAFLISASISLTASAMMLAFLKTHPPVRQG